MNRATKPKPVITDLSRSLKTLAVWRKMWSKTLRETTKFAKQSRRSRCREREWLRRMLIEEDNKKAFINAALLRRVIIICFDSLQLDNECCYEILGRYHAHSVPCVIITVFKSCLEIWLKLFLRFLTRLENAFKTRCPIRLLLIFHQMRHLILCFRRCATDLRTRFGAEFGS